MSQKSTEEESKDLSDQKAKTEEKMSMLENSIMSLHRKTNELRVEIVNHAS